ncbi:serine palmitoyltransferase small subunit [Acrasis kona]|uniref:Serine palmitoyltransferase small subunit n=1 Tax=Acrasis kona TaxID=1008807 RepID=A0AAW2ZRB0_9EUKA
MKREEKLSWREWFVRKRYQYNLEVTSNYMLEPWEATIINLFLLFVVILFFVGLSKFTGASSLFNSIYGSLFN